MDDFPRNPPLPPFGKGGLGGFLKFVANLRKISFLSALNFQRSLKKTRQIFANPLHRLLF